MRPRRNFTIQKLQDAYDCDLDLGDTVSSIFEGETDVSKRLVKVVPAFIGRDFSVPATSNLRPLHEQKRVRELNIEHANKRRRIEQPNGVRQASSRTRDQPVPSTESARSRERSRVQSVARLSRASTASRRSLTGGSMVIVDGQQTGLREFSPDVKEESPELGLAPPSQLTPPPQPSPTPVRNGIANRQSTSRPRSRTPSSPALEVEEHPPTEHPETNGDAIDDIQVKATQADLEEAPAEDIQEAAEDSHEAAIRASPQPTPAPSHHSPPPRRHDIYDVPSSPEFMSNKTKAKRVYGRSPRNALDVQKEVDLLNFSRPSSNPSQKTDLTSAFLQDVQSPAKTTRDSSTPTRRKLDPEIQARLDRLKEVRQRRISKFEGGAVSHAPPVVVPVASAQNNVEPAIVISSAESSSDEEDEEEDMLTQTAATTAGATEELPEGVTRSEPKPELPQFDEHEAMEAQASSPAVNVAEETAAEIQEDEAEGAPAEVQEVTTQEEPEKAVEEVAEEAIDPDSETEAPARFLSRSPSAAGSVSSADSYNTSASPSKATTPRPTVITAASDSSSSDSESSSSDDNDEDEAIDVDMPDAPTQNGAPNTAHPPFPSSPPPVNTTAPPSTLLVPETSQPSASQPVRRTPIPLPSQTPRPAARHTGFRTLREQLADAKTPPTTGGKKPYDPRLTGLSKLIGKKGGVKLGLGKGVAGALEAGEDGESSEEESSSSSSDSD
jgi:hypothetical protein